MQRFVQILGLIVFCFAIGEVLAAFVTSIVFGTGFEDVFKSLEDPGNVPRGMLFLYASLSSLFRFLVVPVSYIFVTKKRSLDFLWQNERFRFSELLYVLALLVVVMPFIWLLMKLNYSMRLPGWLSGVEEYFKEKEHSAQQLSLSVLSFKSLQEAMITIFVVAIVPGIVEEIFFRGIIQARLRDAVGNPHYAVFIAAALFSLFHFQFYGFLPRMAFGVLFGYVYLWTHNIWYPVIAHVINNTVGVLAVYFLGADVLEPYGNMWISWMLLLPSVPLTIFIVRKIISRLSPRSPGV